MTTTQQVKKMVAPYFRSRGFSQKGSSFYRTKDNISCRISFEMPTGLIYVTAYIIPLYIPCDNVYLTYGRRLNNDLRICLPLLEKGATHNEIELWCHSLCNALETYVLPEFDSIDSPAKLANRLRKASRLWLPGLCGTTPSREQLRAYTFLYVHDYARAASAIARCYKEVKKCKYLMKHVKDRFYVEMDALTDIMKQDEEKIEAFFAKIIHNTSITIGEKNVD